MALDSIRLTAIIPATPDVVYAAWIDGKGHSNFTGDTATSEPRVGGKHSAWSGYISGKYLELVPAKKVVQSWRTSEFPSDAKDSRLEVLFEEAGAGKHETKLTLIHTEIPSGQGAQYKDGWGEHYFEPMREYFGSLEKKGAKKAAAKSAVPAKKKAEAKKTPKP
jgi:uncharacterized protein YndB with AHSA1/START domain